MPLAGVETWDRLAVAKGRPHSLWDALETSDVRAIVLTGAGDKAFCAGADVSGDLSASEEMARMINRALLKTSSYPKPIIAAVNGVCAGGGVELMLSCDIRVAASHAKRDGN